MSTNKDKKILIIGMGYVGLSLACLLSKKNNVSVYDTDVCKLNLIDKGISPIHDDLIIESLKCSDNNLHCLYESNFCFFEYVVVCVPTNFDDVKCSFDTSIVDSCIDSIICQNPHAAIIIKSTVPVGYTQSKIMRYSNENIVYCPEFLRETKALYDNLHPSRIIIGASGNFKKGEDFGKILAQSSKCPNVPIMILSPTEAESVKLFSNTYLALRVSFFNELDTFAKKLHLDSKKIIDGVSLDRRCGNFYNNPSFGYGGYCLPKDTKQLLSNYKEVPQNLIKAVIDANDTRMEFIADDVLSQINDIARPIVGIYRLTMKTDSDNFRQSSIFGVIGYLQAKMPEVYIQIYEPLINQENYCNLNILNDLEQFIDSSDIILANRLADEIASAGDKIYSRDIFLDN